MDPVGTMSGWERALWAAEKVKERLRRATKALDDAGVPYAVAGGNAVAEWVARIDDGAVRNTPDIDATWPTRFVSPLDTRLQEVLDDPNG
jgi:hypothetical protein